MTLLTFLWLFEVLWIKIIQTRPINHASLILSSKIVCFFCLFNYISYQENLERCMMRIQKGYCLSDFQNWESTCWALRVVWSSTIHQTYSLRKKRVGLLYDVRSSCGVNTVNSWFYASTEFRNFGVLYQTARI